MDAKKIKELCALWENSKVQYKLRRRVLNPLIGAGLIEPELEDKPNSPKQRYRTVRNNH